MSLVLPGTQGLFSVLQESLRHQRIDDKRLPLQRPVDDFLDDFRWLVGEVVSRPTSINEIVPQPPARYGATEASGKGMGGVFFSPGGIPYLWRKAFQTKVASEVVTLEDKKDAIGISDLELAATVSQHNVLFQMVGVMGQTTHTVQTT
jgi:hypothetical protein